VALSPVGIEYFRLLFDYAYWARDRLLAAASHVDAAEYVAPRELDYGSLRGTLLHVLAGEIIWRNRVQDVSPRQLLSEAEVPTFGLLMEIWQAEDARMRSLLAGLADEDLGREIHYYSTLADREYTQPVWQLLAHLVNHGTQHRAEAALVLTRLGHSPGDLDFIVYLRQKLESEP
jgi:uncharacterized damage-inducible protein DinB